MKNIAQKMIIISFVLALIASAGVFLYLNSLKGAKETIKNISVLVAAETIPPRTLIEKKMIKELNVPDNTFFKDYISDSSKIVGKYSKETILKNEGFYQDKLQDKNGNELSLKIDSNHRAVSISVTGDSGVSNLLKPGDYVDVIVYISQKKDGQTEITPDIAKIILQNIELLAVDKQINRDSKESDAVNNKDKTITSFLVTLSVTPVELEKLVFSESIGTIRLALRPMKDNTITKTSGTTLKDITVNTNSTTVVATNGKSDLNNTKETYISYTVKKGDTLKLISGQFYKDENKYTIIKLANNIKDENYILPGQVIRIPTQQGVR